MKAPWHLWVVGVLALLWNAGGAFDYLMVKFGNEEYLSAMTPVQLVYFTDFPAWANVAWTLGVWGAISGALLLLFRSRFAAVAFAISLLGMAGNVVYGLGVSEVSMLDVAGGFAMTFTLAILIIAVALLVYARRMTRAGVLR